MARDLLRAAFRDCFQCWTTFHGNAYRAYQRQVLIKAEKVRDAYYTWLCWSVGTITE